MSSVDDVLDGVGGFGECVSVSPAPPAPLVRQVFKPAFREHFYGLDAGRILSRLGTMGDGLDRGLSLPAQVSVLGRTSINVLEASPVLNAKTWSITQFLLQRTHRLLIRISRATKYFVIQSIEAFPLFTWFIRTGRIAKDILTDTWNKFIYPLKATWWLFKKGVVVSYRAWLWFYRRFIKQLPMTGRAMNFIAMWSPANLRYTLPYEKEGIKQGGLLILNLIWASIFFPEVVLTTVLWWPGISTIYFSAFSHILAFLLGLAFAAVGFIAANLAAGAVYFLVASAGVLAGAAGWISSVITSILGPAAGTTAAGVAILLSYLLATLTAAGLSSILLPAGFFIGYAPVALFALTVFAIGAGLLFAGIFVTVFSGGLLILAPLLSLTLVIPTIFVHYLVCCWRRYEVESYGTFSSPYYSDIRKVV